ncbi:MAG: ATP-binding protein [Glaciecola sp.]|jgi:two-component system sensor histidine kinase QseC
MRTFSFQSYLTKILVSVLVLLLSVVGYISFQSNTQYLNQRDKTELVNIANVLLQLKFEPTTHDAIQSPQIYTGSSNTLLYAIWENSELIITNHASINYTDISLGWSEKNIGTKRWLLYRQQDRNRDVIVGFDAIEHYRHVDDLLAQMMWPLLIAIPFSILAVIITVKLVSRPLHEMQQQLLQFELHRFEKLELSVNVTELTPVVTTINNLLKDLRSSYEREQSFSGNVAHELRTPLTTLQLELDNIIQAQPDIEPVLQPMRRHVFRLSHFVKQLLLLAQTNPDYFQGQLIIQNPVSLIQDTIIEAYPLLQQKSQSIQFDYDEAKHWQLKLEPQLFRLLLGNIIDNAHKYTQPGADIVVFLQQTENGTALQVDDSGTLLDGDKFDQLLRRTYRAEQAQHTSIAGSGLGLSLVQQIVTLHHARLSLARSCLGGLQVKIIFPAVTTHYSA